MDVAAVSLDMGITTCTVFHQMLRMNGHVVEKCRSEDQNILFFLFFFLMIGHLYAIFSHLMGVLTFMPFNHSF